MNCAECKEYLVAYVEGLLTKSQEQAMASHLRGCPACQAEVTELTSLRDRLVANGKVLAESELEDKVLNRIFREQSLKLRKVSKLNEQLQLWRKIMKSRITKVTAAAVIVIAVVLSITFLDKSVIPVAYALEQTIEANHTVRYLHIKSFRANEDEPKEFWLEFYEDGEVKNVRMHMPEWDSPEDGAKITVWKENKAQIWFKKKKSLVTIRDKTVAANILNFIKELDPKLVVERLYYGQQAQGEVEIEIDEPSNKAEPIVVTATCLPGSLRAGWRVVLFVDRATKLVTAIEFYKLKDDKYEYVELIEYYDYNQPIEAEMFNLENEVPAGVPRVDQDLEKARLEQKISPDEKEKYERMTPKEMTRAFFEACAEEDWDEVLIFSPSTEVPKWLKNTYGGLEIISIGEPFKSGIYPGWFVPYEVKLRSGEIRKFNLAVRNDNPAKRYVQDGGI